MPPGIDSTDNVETRLGTFKFFDGFPDKATDEKNFDNLDFQRAAQAYLLAIPAVSQAMHRNACRTRGPISRTTPILEQLVDSQTVGLTFNDSIVYNWD
jgi:hypothetical protein